MERRKSAPGIVGSATLRTFSVVVPAGRRTPGEDHAGLGRLSKRLGRCAQAVDLQIWRLECRRTALNCEWCVRMQILSPRATAPESFECQSLSPPALQPHIHFPTTLACACCAASPASSPQNRLNLILTPSQPSNAGRASMKNARFGRNTSSGPLSGFAGEGGRMRVAEGERPV